MSENKRKHLEFIQAVVNRLANTSFLLKGWSITMVAGLFAFAVKTDGLPILAMALLLTLVFLFLDSYFLWQERLYRQLYEQVRLLDEPEINFSMDASSFAASEKWWPALFSLTLAPFYGAVVTIITIFLFRMA
jgi:hypothetical protein